MAVAVAAEVTGRDTARAEVQGQEPAPPTLRPVGPLPLGPLDLHPFLQGRQSARPMELPHRHRP